jgi:hypothetical protein
VFTGYFASLGIKAENIVYSDFTSEELYKEGAKRGAIDPCFPSKLGIPHVHNLLYQGARQEAARHHLLPDDRLPDQRPALGAGQPLLPHRGHHAGSGEGGVHQGRRPVRRKGRPFLDTFVNLSKPDVFERQMYEQFRDILGLSPEENQRAVRKATARSICSTT